ncbi:Hydroxymethylpyrimidine pyrophosphatase [Paenibacillus sp. OK060]|uniref:HAD family hydrolase n=1 Tax=Paenibacillus sp. OK060 TaxID=1881034 RepID=UPI00088334EB|nr:HAD family hydrolase [Paenibacillus sp. OK060]SDL16340.1 Hydroxymethylpyrimidine pyrophosphatase [Paenibacillus sp. OK060]
MIYASDLDQTLIYSRRSMGVSDDASGIAPVEWIRGELSSFMSDEALNRLKALPEDIIFMPVTTRTVEQYQRIQIFQQDVIPAYAVTSNGGNILIAGEVDQSWNGYVRSQLQQHSAEAVEVRQMFGDVLNSDWVAGERLCDELFFAFVIHRDRMPIEQVTEKIQALESLGWEASIQGRKLYLVPSGVNKRAAVEYVRHQIGNVPVIASGDSLLDRCLLDFADYAIAPRHGELYREKQRNPELIPYRFTEKSGIFAADEILEYVCSTHQVAIGDAVS